MKKLAERILGWLLSLAWNRIRRMAATITIDGITFPITDFEKAANALIQGFREHKSPGDILQSLEPASLPIIETIATNYLPGLGLAIGLVAFAEENKIPMKDLSQDEVNRIQTMRDKGQ